MGKEARRDQNAQAITRRSEPRAGKKEAIQSGIGVVDSVVANRF